MKKAKKREKTQKKMEDITVRLYNKKKVKLVHSIFEEQDIISAIAHKKIVASVSFSVMRIFEKRLSGQERRILSEKNHTMISLVPTTKILKFAMNNPSLKNCRDGIFTDAGGEEFVYKKSECEIHLISIKDETYFKTGLGSALYRAAEKVAAENGCTLIYAYFHPFGKGRDHAKSFYLKNGFVFEESPAEKCTYAVKILDKTPAAENASSAEKAFSAEKSS